MAPVQTPSVQQVSQTPAPHVVSSENDVAQLRRILMADPAWATYALADLQPALAADCRWITATAGSSEALALIYSGLEPPILFTMGETDMLAAALVQADLPPVVYASIREQHLPVVARHYDLTGDLHPMWRMVLTAPQAVEENRQSSVTPGRLDRTQAGAIQQLLAQGGRFAPDAFSPAQLETGIFFGVWGAGQELLAMGGTHVVDFTAGIAAVGNMYTHPAYRRRGFSTAILRALVSELIRCGVSNIVLNVDQRNSGAQAIYLAHGFTVHTPYLEGKGRRTVI